MQECIKCKFEWSVCVLLDKRHWQHDPDQLELVNKNEICKYVICKLMEHGGVHRNRIRIELPLGNVGF